MQAAGYVWRRNDDRVGLSVRVLVDLGCKKAAVLPAFVVVLFGFFRVVCFGKFHKQKVYSNSKAASFHSHEESRPPLAAKLFLRSAFMFLFEGLANELLGYPRHCIFSDLTND